MLKVKLVGKKKTAEIPVCVTKLGEETGGTPAVGIEAGRGQ